MLLLDSVI